MKCPNFREYNTNEEVQTILSLPVPEDKKKRKMPSEEDDGIYFCNFNFNNFNIYIK